MNIFVLHEDPRKAPLGLCDTHLTKMPLESVQILNTALHLNGAASITFYGRGYVNHPCCTWAAESYANWKWLYTYTLAIGERFERERGKTHLSIDKLLDNIPEPEAVASYFDSDEPTPFFQAMPEQYRNSDTVTAYRRYYYFDKSAKPWFDHATCARRWFE